MLFRSTVVVGSTRSARIRGFDPTTGKQLWQRSLHDSFNLLGLAAHPAGDQVVSTFVFHRHHAIARNNIEQGWALDNRVARIRPEPGEDLNYDQIALDSRGQAVADPTGIAYSADGSHMAITSAGAQELLLVPTGKVPWSNGDPGDFVDSALEFPVRLLRRIDLGGRPQGLAFAGAKVLMVGMQMPPNYGAAYGREFVGLFEQIAREEKSALVPFLLKGVADQIGRAHV